MYFIVSCCQLLLLLLFTVAAVVVVVARLLSWLFGLLTLFIAATIFALGFSAVAAAVAL